MRAAPGSGMLGFIGDPTGEMKVMAAPSLWDNPLGTDGFEFVEYAAPDPAALGRLFEQMGFSAIAKHRSKNVLLYRQGDINFIVNAEPGQLCAGLRARARSVDLRDGVSRQGRRRAPTRS